MKFVCLRLIDETNWGAMPEKERKSYVEQCIAYDEELRRGGHLLGGQAPQGARSAATLRVRSGQVVVTDGPFARTKERLGGLLFLEAWDLNHAIVLLSNHPGVRAGAFEIRAADEGIHAQIAARNV